MAKKTKVWGRLRKNTYKGSAVATVEKLGQVPPCVKDALSWLPYPYGVIGRGKKTRTVWFWEGIIEDREPALRTGAEPPQSVPADGQRCHRCIFQEPVWSQNYAMCSFSWLNDRDGECRAFTDREEFLEQQPSYAGFCVSPRLETDALLARPYRTDGTLYSQFSPSTNLPNAFYASLNLSDWYNAGAWQVYEAIETERLRRFREWTKTQTVEQTGTFQLNMFLDL